MIAKTLQVYSDTLQLNEILVDSVDSWIPILVRLTCCFKRGSIMFNSKETNLG